MNVETLRRDTCSCTSKGPGSKRTPVASKQRYNVAPAHFQVHNQTESSSIKEESSGGHYHLSEELHAFLCRAHPSHHITSLWCSGHRSLCSEMQFRMQLLIKDNARQCSRAPSKHVRSLRKISCAAACCGMLRHASKPLCAAPKNRC